MITRPVYNIGVLVEPTYIFAGDNWYKTNWSDWNDIPIAPLRKFTPSGWTTASVYRFNDGYREINITDGKRYIDPFDGTSLLTEHSEIHNSVFTQKLSFPIDESTYTNYLVTGIYIDDYAWERCDSDYREGDIEEPHYWRTNIYKYTISNGKTFVTNKKIVLSHAVDLSDTTTIKPVYPYSNKVWRIHTLENN